MELWLPDQATLMPLIGGVRLGWVEAPIPVRWVTPAEAEKVARDDTIVLASPLARASRSPSHVVVSDVCVAAEPRGTVALASEQRPDELGEIDVDAREASAASAALAGILRVLHFGAGGLWHMTATPRPGPAARLVDGDSAVALLFAAEAAATDAAKLQVAAERAGLSDAADETVEHEPSTPPGGVVEDLARAWFVLTGLPWVSHLLYAPAALADRQGALLSAIVAALRESIRLGQERDAELVAEAAARLGLPTRPVRSLLRLQRHTLGPTEQQALATFYARATRYTGLADLPAQRVVSAEQRAMSNE